MDDHIPYMMNYECELKFFDLKPALEPDLTLEPKLIFQELVLFREDLDTRTPLKEQIESLCEDVCIVDEPLFIDELFKDECDHSNEKIHVDDFNYRVPFEKNLILVSSLSMSLPMINHMKTYVKKI